MIKLTDSPEKTYGLGFELASQISTGTVVAMHGNLGGGKTTFAQGLASGFGVKGRVSSPSYILVKEYALEGKKSSLTKIYHLDLYRLDNYEKDELGIVDMLKDKGNLVLIEWAEKAKRYLPAQRIDIYFKQVSDGKREISIIDRRNKKILSEDQALEVLENGGVVIFPTDTAFGIGCRVDREVSVERLFKIRERPRNKPVPVLCSDMQMIKKYAAELSEETIKLMERYWPGALTVVVKAKKGMLLDLVTGGTDTVGLRIPNEKMLHGIIERIGIPLIGTSANFHGQPTPYAFDAVNDGLIKLTDGIIYGETKVKRESTVVDCTGKKWNILRQGAIKLDI